MSNRRIITLTTDFGYQDPFVGVMKGVIFRINRDVDIIDLSHGIRPQDITDAAFTIGMNYSYFPDGTIHMVIVDPGVGSARRPLLVRAGHNYFIGPDNGVFSRIYETDRGVIEAINITSLHYFLTSQSPTFQGRDVFAPVAAWLSKGVDMYKFGERIEDYEKIMLPVPVFLPNGGLSGQVIRIDRFGNAITNISPTDIERLSEQFPGQQVVVKVGQQKVALKRFYSETDEGVPGALINSSGLLEIFVYKGNAARACGIAVGDSVELR